MRAADTLVLPLSSVHAKVDLESLISKAVPAQSTSTATELSATHPFVTALSKIANSTSTTNGARAFKSTEDACLDFFSELSSAGTDLRGPTLVRKLTKAWADDAICALRVIFYARSIVDGAGERLLFYRCCAWLLSHHPLSLIANLHVLVENVGPSKEVSVTEDDIVELVQRPGRLHGSYKDLLNVALIAIKGLDENLELVDLMAAPKLARKETKRAKLDTAQPREEKTDQSTCSSRNFTSAAGVDVAQSLERALSTDATVHAVYFTVADLFATRLRADQSALDSGDAALHQSVAYAGKWAPTEAKSVDRQTCLASTIAQRMYPDAPVAAARCQYSRLLVRLRSFVAVPEQRMRQGDWKIKYAKVPAVAFRRNEANFAKHDLQNYTDHLEKVALGKATIAGASTSPATLAYEAIHFANSTLKMPKGLSHEAANGVREKLRDLSAGRINGQWESLVRTLRDEIDSATQLVQDEALATQAGSLALQDGQGKGAGLPRCLALRKAQALLQMQGCIAVCDVSGSMCAPYLDKTNTIAPLHAAVGLSLLLSELAAPPWNHRMITFSNTPEVVELDAQLRFVDQVTALTRANWGYSTAFDRVFDLLLDMAKEYHLARSDTAIKIFVFSDMQFNAASAERQTNFKSIETKYRKAGYDMPHLVFWNLAARDNSAKPVTAETEHVTLLSGFSGSQLKAFLNGTADTALDEELKEKEEDKSSKKRGREGGDDEDFEIVEEKKPAGTTPLQTMRRILGAESFQGLKVYD